MEVTRAGADANSHALRQLRTWTSECSSVRVFMVLGSPKNFEAYVTKRLDGKPGLSASQLDDTWYYSMLVCMSTTILCCCGGFASSQSCCVCCPLPLIPRKVFARFYVELC